MIRRQLSLSQWWKNIHVSFNICKINAKRSQDRKYKYYAMLDCYFRSLVKQSLNVCKLHFNTTNYRLCYNTIFHLFIETIFSNYFLRIWTTKLDVFHTEKTFYQLPVEHKSSKCAMFDEFLLIMIINDHYKIIIWRFFKWKFSIHCQKMGLILANYRTSFCWMFAENLLFNCLLIFNYAKYMVYLLTFWRLYAIEQA